MCINPIQQGEQETIHMMPPKDSQLFQSQKKINPSIYMILPTRENITHSCDRTKELDSNYK